MDNEIILQKIEEICKNRRWSMYRLSACCGIAQSTLSSLFKSRSNISLTNLDRICEAFHMTMSQFFLLIEEKEEAIVDSELIMMIKEADLSEQNRRLLKTMIVAMKELDRELLESKK